MNHLFFTALLGAGMALSVSVPALADPVADACMSKTLYSDETCGCVAMEAQNLSEGQYELLVAAVDGEMHLGSTDMGQGLGLADAARVSAFIWTTAPSCIADRM